ncbi:amino acid ABC transporter permease [Kallotenue papyrolyticum]|uniref:amino acid ABC transporter permease n=1 Tax=Kallotenue papyrolyticum TaxID=1325125 RepID=UPI0004786274|nr:amino acid ABC transporter permease [Kallotenue papyrolyticum]
MSTTQAPVSTMKPPRASTNVVVWLRKNLFNGWLNSIITVVLVWGLAMVLYRFGRWALSEAFWAPIPANLRLFMVGRYPAEQLWRVQAALALILALFGVSGGRWGGLLRAIALGLLAATALLALIPLGIAAQLFWLGMAALIGAGYLLARRVALPRWPIIVLWLLSPFLCLLLIGGIDGSRLLPAVNSRDWGGLLLTIVLAVFPIVLSFPLGVLLALGRRSRLPVVKGFCVAYIETIRGVPLITVLYMGSLMLPLFINANPAAVTRAVVALTLFSAAYLAENVRGGLQAVPNGQIEAAKALGLNVFQTTLLIVLPQALRAVIPAIVGQFISLFKDTSLVAIIGLSELLGIAAFVWTQPQWLGTPGGVQREVLLFVALIYWIFCFSMFQLSRRIEQRLGVGTR